MENNRQPDLDRWVDEHLAALVPPAGWQPDTAAGLEQFRRGRMARAARRRTAVWICAAVAAVSAGALAFPSTRVFARRCVDACLAQIQGAPNLPSAAIPKPGELVPPETRAFATDFNLTDVSGHPVRLSDLRGRVVLLNFWATWCGPCKVEMPWFLALQRDYHDAGLSILGVSMDDDGWTSVAPFLNQIPVNYPIAVGNDDLAAQYGGVEQLPTTFLIDREGRIAETFVGLKAKEIYEQAIQYLLAEK